MVNINNMLELELLKNIKTFIASADLVYNTKDFTSAAILYFKALFASLDYLILTKGWTDAKRPRRAIQNFGIQISFIVHYIKRHHQNI